jgi:diguanylate cyclase (GGDEF)-like protein
VLVEEAGPHIARAASLYGAKHRAMTDDLTGQPNRRALHEAMQQRRRGECSLLRVHVDQLAELEQRAASAVLRHVAGIFRRSLRDYDVAARVDEEFALYLPDTPFHHAVGVADRVLIAVSESVFDWAGREFLITCSFGVASVPHESASTDSLLGAAEKALSSAKSKGRNRISAVHPELN